MSTWKKWAVAGAVILAVFAYKDPHSTSLFLHHLFHSLGVFWNSV